MNTQFENKADKLNRINYTRYIASWNNVAKDSYLGPGSKFEKWLKSLKLDDEDIDNIVYIAKNGKLELETSIKHFLKNN